MIRLATAFCLGLLLCLCTNLAAQDRYYFSEDWETIAVPDNDDWNIEAADPAYTIIETTDEITHSGSRVLKAELYNPDKLHKRAEVAHTHKAMMGEQYFYRFSMYLPTTGYPQNNTDGTTFTIITQWHATPDFSLGETWRVPNLVLRMHENGQLGAMLCYNALQVNDNTTSTKVNFKDDNGDNFDIPKGQWVDFEVSVKWTHTSSGYVDIWMDGTQIVSYDGPTSYNDVKGPYMKLGIYRTPWITERETIYYDNLQILRNGLIVFPDHDTFVRGGSYENSNYGSATTITTKHNLNQLQYDRQSYLHFNYDQFADYVLTAGNLFVHTHSSNTTEPLLAHRVENNWDESTLTYLTAGSLNVFDYQGSGDTSLESFEIAVPDVDLDFEIALRLTFDVSNAMITLPSSENTLITKRPMLFLEF